MAARNKFLAVLLISAAITASALVVSVDAQSELCFCPCMRLQCMTIPGAVREDCAEACQNGCVQAKYPGRSRPDDYCGF